MERQKWMTYGPVGNCIVYVVPQDEAELHNEGIECLCKPRIINENVSLLIVHNNLNSKDLN